MEQSESHAEIAKRLVETLRSLVVNFPEHVQSNIDLLKKTLASPKESQMLISALIGFALLFQLYLKFVCLSAVIFAQYHH